MAKDYSQHACTHVRRSDRAVEDETWIKQFLHEAPMGVMATVHESQPFINSNIYVYDEAAHAIYLHTAKVGRTQANVDKAEQVCFSVSSMGRLLPAEEALHFSVEYAGVTIFGSARIITEQEEATHGLQLLLDKYFPHLEAGQDYHPPVVEELKRTAVFRIDIAHWSAKRKQVEPEFPGAFLYESKVPQTTLV
ncbi:pyridoxamine 5'-phosphate oxidase family protein [Anaerolineales bacterium HSG25]|nr:pyridoxamine 5'-phosphate oxidase family protein [Anaerolineales bacterium HSG25]